MIDSDHNQSNNDIGKSVCVRHKRRKYDRFRKTNDTIIASGEEPNQSDPSSDEEGFQLIDDFNDYKSDIDESFLDDDELFAAPSSNFNYDPDEENITVMNDSWILLWIFKF